MLRIVWKRLAAVPLRFATVLLIALLFACAPEAQTISPQVLAEYLAKGKAGRIFNLVDLRPREAFSARHLPDAISIPYDRLATDRLLFLDGLPVIFYDETKPDLDRLTRAVGSRLPRNVVFLEGGFRGWFTARLPVAVGM